MVPPLLAFGMWFAGWHALRHTGRLIWLLRAVSPAVGPWPAARRFAAHAVVPTVVTTAAVVLTSWDDSAVAVSAALSVLVALTFPHVLSVHAFDRWAAEQVREGP